MCVRKYQAEAGSIRIFLEWDVIIEENRRVVGKGKGRGMDGGWGRTQNPTRDIP